MMSPCLFILQKKNVQIRATAGTGVREYVVRSGLGPTDVKRM